MANKKEELLKALKTMAPGDVMAFVADQMGMNPVKFLTKNAGQLALKAAKAGWVKAGGIKDAMKDFSAKNAEDTTGIDWNDVKVDEDAVKLTCLFDRDSGKKLKDFVKDLSDKMAEFAKEEKELDEAQRKLTEALSKDPTDHLAVSLLSCVKKLKTATGRNVAGKMWEMQVMSYMKEKGIKMSYSDMMKVASGKMTSGDDALDGMCSMFDSLKGSKSTEVIADAAELFKDKELMDAYGDKFKSAMKYAGKFQGNDVFDIAGSAAAGTVADKALSGAKNFKQMQAAFDDLDSGVKKEIEDLMKQGPQGALKAADKLGKLSGGNAGA